MRRQILLVALVLEFFLCTASFGAGARAAEPEEARMAVAVEYVPPTLSLRISQPTDLRTILQAICQRTETRCEIAPHVAEVVVVPLTLAGTWDEVVAKLLEGTRLNYLALVPHAGHAGQLLVQAPGAVRSAARAEQRQLATPLSIHPNRASLTDDEIRQLRARQAAERADPPSRAVTDPAPASRQASLPDEEIRQLRSIQPRPTRRLPPPLPSLSEQLAGVDPARVRVLTGQSINQAKRSSEQIRASEASFRMMYGGFAATQTSGSPSRTIVLPFPDHNGNTISVTVTNQPITVLPWSGPDGRPIVIPPGKPGLKLQYPIPPTHSSIKKD